MLKPLRAYMVSSDAPEEGACLVFARTVYEAKRIAWQQIDWLRDLCAYEYINARVKWLQDGAHYHRIPELEERGAPYVVECPASCHSCDLWKESGIVSGTDLCISCFEAEETWD